MKKLKIVTVGILVASMLFAASFLLLSEQVPLISAYALEDDEYPECGSFWQGFNISNLEPFRNFLETQGFVFDDDSTFELLLENFDDLYYQALELGYIEYLTDDILRVHTRQEEIDDTPIVLPQWSSDRTINRDNYGTHQVLAREAYKFVQPLFPDIFIPLSPLNLDEINPNYGHNLVTRYVDYPDGANNLDFFLNGLNYDHFYNANNGGNYFRVNINLGLIDGNNARTRFIQHYNQAVNLWNAGRRNDAYRSLGRALHFIQDMATPHHVGDQMPLALAATLPPIIALIILPATRVIGIAAATVLLLYIADTVGGHARFETVAKNNQERILTSRRVNGVWDFQRDYSNLSFDQMIRSVVDRAYSFYPLFSFFGNHVHIAENTIPNAVDATISVLKKFAMQVGGGFGVETNATGYTIWGVGNLSGSLEIPAVIHGRQVTQIAANGFSNHPQLSEIAIPSTVESIGNNAFPRNMQVVLLEERTKIQEYLFANQANLASVTIPATVRYINMGAFENATGLREVNFADDSQLQEIGANVFSGARLLSQISIPASVISMGANTFPRNMHVILADGRTHIQAGLFANQSDLSSVTIPSSVTYIGDYAFAHTGLTSVTNFRTSPQSINSTAFFGVDISRVILNVPEGAVAIYVNVPFWQDFNVAGHFIYLTEYFDGGIKITGIDGTISSNANIPYAIDGQTVVAIAANAFFNEGNLREITIPTHVRYIGDLAFPYETLVIWLGEFKVRGSTFISYLGNSAAFEVPTTFAGRPILSIASEAFLGNTRLTSVIVPHGIITIGARAFNLASGLTNITLPSSVTCLCTANLAFHANTTVTWAGRHIFRNNIFIRHLGTETDFSVPRTLAGRSITILDGEAFYRNTHLQRVYVPCSIVTIRVGAFYRNTALVNIDVCPASQNFRSVGGVLFNRAITTLIKYPAGTTRATTYTVPNTVTIIRSRAFDGNTRLTGIVFASTLVTIESFAFRANTRLNSVTFQTDFVTGSTMTSINEGAFMGTTALTSISIPSRLRTIGVSAFENSGVRSIEIRSNAVIPENLRIRERAFFGTRLTSVSFPARVISIGSEAFANIAALQEIHFANNSAGTIGARAFAIGTGTGPGSNPNRTLTVINNRNSTPQTINADSVFAGRDRGNINLRVPLGRGTAYQNAGWRGFRVSQTLFGGDDPIALY